MLTKSGPTQRATKQHVVKSKYLKRGHANANDAIHCTSSQQCIFDVINYKTGYAICEASNANTPTC